MLKRLVWNLVAGLLLPVFILAALLPSRRRDLLIWGSRPLPSFAYWSRAMSAVGWPSMTLMEGYYHISSREDFDRYLEDFAPAWLPHVVRMGVGASRALTFVLRRGRVLHTSFDGLVLRDTVFWRWEQRLCRMAGVRTVILPYGADGYVYSRMIDTSMRYGLLASYPHLARREKRIGQQVDYWCATADCVVAGFMVDGIGRWDVTMNTIFAIDTDAWTPKTEYSDADGVNAPVRIMHTPNHRGYKGTEFLLAAVGELKAEGWLIDLVLLEKVPNAQVREIMPTADIMAEQFIGIGYALSGIEGMACGLPVLANLDHEAYTRVFRRYGFLDECPILSSPPERLRDNLRLLIRHPDLRRELGQAGRAFAEKYHSYRTAQYMFGRIYDRILGNKDVDLINLFHPLKSDYNRSSPRVQHPLEDNRLPPDDPRHSR